MGSQHFDLKVVCRLRIHSKSFTSVQL